MLLFKTRPRGKEYPGSTLRLLGSLWSQSLLLAWGTGRCVVPVGWGEVVMGFGEGA